MYLFIYIYICIYMCTYIYIYIYIYIYVQLKAFRLKRHCLDALRCKTYERWLYNPFKIMFKEESEIVSRDFGLLTFKPVCRTLCLSLEGALLGLLYSRNVQRFRGGLVSQADRLLDSRLQSNKEEGALLGRSSVQNFQKVALQPT